MKKKAGNFADNLKDFSNNIGNAYFGLNDLLSSVADGFQEVESVGKTAGNTVITALKGIGAASTGICQL